jgi:E3 ubiquitin-protein ligase listerin
MCHLVTDSSVEVQKMAYQMLHKAAKKRTESVVVEAGVDTDGAYEAKLPVELVELLSQQIDPIEGNAQVCHLFRLIEYQNLS